MPDPSLPNDRESIADAASLFDTDEVRPFKAPTVGEGSATTGPADGYDLAANPFPTSEGPPRPVPLPTPVARPKPRPQPKPKPPPVPNLGSDLVGSSEFEGEIAVVDPTWSRGAEWGPDLARVAIAGLVALALLYFSFNSSSFLFFLILGGLTLAVLSYPLLITLERPVRITPEHAVADFFSAASHRFPHYRRMWLLLSSAGRGSGPFPDLGDFRDHWRRRMDEWKSSLGGNKLTPLAFEIGDFHADKSTGKSTSRADYTIRIKLRGASDPAKTLTYRMVHGLVKGPDRMWYLNQGKLPSDTI